LKLNPSLSFELQFSKLSNEPRLWVLSWDSPNFRWDLWNGPYYKLPM
jgi:hypothetical protein